MKTPSDPRHRRRQKIIQLLFASSFRKLNNNNDLFKKILEDLDQIDTIVKTIAPEFPVEKINKVDLAILRLAVYELSIGKTAPSKVIVDEAIELAKEFGGESSPAFINGALANLLKQ